MYYLESISMQFSAFYDQSGTWDIRIYEFVNLNTYANDVKLRHGYRHNDPTHLRTISLAIAS